VAIEVIPTEIPEVLIIQPQIFADERGYFFEAFNERDFSSALGQSISFVQDNHSCSKQGVVRGLHYQLKQVQGKLVRVVEGSVFDVAVDMRKTSPTYGRWVGVELSSDNKKQLWIPPGFAHGFLVLSERAQFLYKTTDFWDPKSEQCLLWNDPEIAINWPTLNCEFSLNAKDLQGHLWEQAPKYD
jgi:dTDP-4-dehydrorhamnose 3,5-epimerase